MRVIGHRHGLGNFVRATCKPPTRTISSRAGWVRRAVNAAPSAFKGVRGALALGGSATTSCTDGSPWLSSKRGMAQHAPCGQTRRLSAGRSGGRPGAAPVARGGAHAVAFRGVRQGSNPDGQQLARPVTASNGAGQGAGRSAAGVACPARRPVAGEAPAARAAALDWVLVILLVVLAYAFFSAWLGLPSLSFLSW